MSQCSISPKINVLHSQEQCPKCRRAFIAGYTADNSQTCPYCHQQYHPASKKPTRYCGTSNVYYKDGCPALMSDGRFMTNHHSSNELTEQLRKSNSMDDHNRFRNFLQNNAEELINAERDYMMKNNSCTVSTACSQGWHDLWSKNGGVWNYC